MGTTDLLMYLKQKFEGKKVKVVELDKKFQENNFCGSMIEFIEEQGENNLYLNLFSYENDDFLEIKVWYRVLNEYYNTETFEILDEENIEIKIIDFELDFL